MKLETKDLIDVFFDDTRLLGIMAPIKDYLFCWQLNTILGLDFRNNNELEIELVKKKRRYFFAVYEYSNPSSFLVNYLYNNQCSGEYLLPEFKHLDFLWLLKGDGISDVALQELVQSIKNINGVQLVLELTNEKIKNKEHLIF